MRASITYVDRGEDQVSIALAIENAGGYERIEQGPGLDPLLAMLVGCRRPFA